MVPKWLMWPAGEAVAHEGNIQCMDGPAVVVEYDPGWPMLFEALCRRVRPAVADIAHIEHVGSTAVVGLAGKPIIDMDVVVRSASDVATAVERLVAVGYSDQGDLGIPGRQALRPPEDGPYHHLYVVVEGNRAHRDHVDLRDYLRRHPDDARRYAVLKRKIAYLLATDRNAYVSAKSELVEELLTRARRDARGPSDLVLAVVFDMDGTLFDSTECVTTAYRRAVVAAGGPEYTTADIVAAYPLGPPAVILRHLLGRPATTSEETAYLALLREHQDLILVYDGIRDVLDELVSASVRMAVFTGASTAAARQLLAATRLLKCFSVVVGGDDVARPKPEPDGILLACDRLGVEPHRTAYVGDSPLDVDAARRSGALAIGAAWGHLFDPDEPCDLVANLPQDLLSVVRPFKRSG